MKKCFFGDPNFPDQEMINMSRLAGLPSLVYGAVYFRKSNPPREDWERDYQTAAQDGLNVFRHWFLWSAIEVASGEYDWDDYDRQLELAAKYGLKTIIAEHIAYAPEWLYARHPHARREDRQGRKADSEMNISCCVGGLYSMCLDNPEVSEAAGRFLTELANRYKDHPGLGGYDLWNECSYYGPGLLCHCPATQEKFRRWLRNQYGDLQTLARKWRRYSYADWSDVLVPRQVAQYPEVLDFARFQVDNTYQWLKWRADVIRRADPNHPVAAHGLSKTHSDIVTAAGDDWRAAAEVDLYGYTHFYGNGCSALLSGDMARCASRGKTFWRAEAVGDHDWLHRRPGPYQPEKDAMEDPLNIRLDHWLTLVTGSRGVMNPRWRPLLDGPLFGAFGWYGMDGSRTSRSEMASSLARWVTAPDQKALFDAAPIRGEIAVLILEEAQAYCYVNQGDTRIYRECVEGAYSAFVQANVQCDFVRLPHIGEYDLLYLPFPVALSGKTISTLRTWIEEGGCLISEGCIGYFDEQAHAFPQQPNRGLEAVLGCVEDSVSFAPDRWGHDLPIQFGENQISGGVFRQTYSVTTGAAVGWYEDGEIAAVDNAFGTGRVRLVGSMPGYAYYHSPAESLRRWFAGSLSFAAKKQLISVDRENIIARRWRGNSGDYLWIINESSSPESVTLKLDLPLKDVRSVRGGGDEVLNRNAVTTRVDGRDATILLVS